MVCRDCQREIQLWCDKLLLRGDWRVSRSCGNSCYSSCSYSPTKNVTALPRSFQTTGIEIAAGHQTLSDKKCYMSGTHASKQDILSCTLSLSIICGKS